MLWNKSLKSKSKVFNKLVDPFATFLTTLPSRHFLKWIFFEIPIFSHNCSKNMKSFFNWVQINYVCHFLFKLKCKKLHFCMLKWGCKNLATFWLFYFDCFFVIHHLQCWLLMIYLIITSEKQWFNCLGTNAWKNTSW